MRASHDIFQDLKDSHMAQCLGKFFIVSAETKGRDGREEDLA